MRKKKIAILGLVLMMVLSMSLIGCNKEVKDEEVIAKVNEEIVTKTEFDKSFEIIKKTYEAQFGPDIWSQDMGEGRTFEETAKEMVLENLIMNSIILQNAEKMDVKVTDEQLEEELTNYKGYFASEKEYEAMLESNNMTEAYLKEEMRRTLIIDAFKEKIINEDEISEEELKKYYEDNADAYDKVKARHILVKTEEEAKDILNQLRDGADFEELAKTKSQDPGSATNGGDLGYFGRGMMVPEFEETAFTLNVGEVSGMVQTSYGYHIIKVEDKLDSYELLENEVKKYMQDVKFNEKLSELREEAKVEKFEEKEIEEEK